MSLETGKIIARIMKAHPGEWDAPTIATTLAFICGFIVLGLGLLRLGWIVEFIPAPAVSGFMTGSAINIAASQVPGLFGIANRLECVMPLFCVFSSMTILLQYERSNVLGHHKYIKEPSLFNYRCSIRRGRSCWYVLEPFFFSNLSEGAGAFQALYGIKWTFAYLTKRYPRYERTFFFISVLRNAFVMVILTLASWLYCRHRGDSKGNFPISILKAVPRGFQVRHSSTSRDIYSAD